MEISGTKGIKPRDPVGCVVRSGIKSSRGFPEHSDQFYIVNVKEENGIRHLHPSFSGFNTAPLERRKVIRGNLVHATKEQCFEHQYKAQIIKKPAHPNRRPHCIGDGEKAVRWVGPGPDDFQDIPCPNRFCEFRQGKTPACKPWMRIYFKLRWQENSPFPQFLTKLNSRGYETVSNFKGFFQYIEDCANQLGLKKYTLFGLPFTITLSIATKPSERTRYPVISISPEIDPIDFFRKQQQAIKEIQSYNYEQIIDATQQDPAVLLEDLKDISFGK